MSKEGKYFITDAGLKRLPFLKRAMVDTGVWSDEVGSRSLTKSEEDQVDYSQTFGYQVDILDNLKRHGFIDSDDSLFSHPVYRPYFRQLIDSGYVTFIFSNRGL